jgi:glycosyltransferase involved in cell wall biosynthesis
MSGKPRIAVFQANWRFHSSTAFSALMLAEAGYVVDVFLYLVDESLPMGILEKSKDIFIHSFCPRTSATAKMPAGGGGGEHQRRITLASRVWRRLFGAARRFVQGARDLMLLCFSPEMGLVPAEICRRTLEIMQSGHYKALIGVDKGGLVWAGAISPQHGIPLLYSSLELYTRDLQFDRTLWDKRVKKTEETLHKQCWATIIQDEQRGGVLLEDNRVQGSMKMLYVPISRMGGAVKLRTKWLQNSLKLVEDEILILAHGMIAERRLSLELARVAQGFPDDWRLVFHGWGSEDVIRKIRKLDSEGRVSLSLELVDLSQETEVVASAHIGLVLYGNKSANDRLTAFSSEKIAICLQCGVPVIAFDYPGYDHLRDEGCGVLVKDVTEIPKAVEIIVADYDNYRTNAFKVFEKHYRFETNFKKVIEALAELP